MAGTGNARQIHFHGPNVPGAGLHWTSMPAGFCAPVGAFKISYCQTTLNIEHLEHFLLTFIYF
jgi:hypothetical protein